ncbi:unnamed protein product [Linum tenue]|uniref:Uncharacterized protein n=1 Tax=Linum tenue TaxID=586396 RepID=A0AAV0IQ18_9ROSI|nr:unnamed protein product [Linum tenue]
MKVFDLVWAQREVKRSPMTLIDESAQFEMVFKLQILLLLVTGSHCNYF